MYVLVKLLFWIAVSPFLGKKLSFRLSVCSVVVHFKCVLLPNGVLERKVLVVSIPDHCLPFYLITQRIHMFLCKLNFDRVTER